MELNTAVGADEGVVAGRQLFNADEGRARGQTGPSREDLIECQRIKRQRHGGMDGHGLDLGPENERTFANGIVQWPDTDPVAGEEEFALERVPDGDAELAVEPAQAGRPFLFVVMQEDFGVAMRRQTVAVRQQLFAEFGVVEDFAVVNDPETSVLVGDGLLAATKVNDAKAGVAKADVVVEVDAELVGSAMADHGQHAPEQSLGGRFSGAKIQITGNAAHGEAQFVMPNQ